MRDRKQFGVYEWLMTDKWDPSIPEHKAIAHNIDVGAALKMKPISEARDTLKQVGFEILHEEDLAERPDPVVRPPLLPFW
jgi:sterol 24-C-methyltransferase